MNPPTPPPADLSAHTPMMQQYLQEAEIQSAR
jgi:hypothetical protein